MAKLVTRLVRLFIRIWAFPTTLVGLILGLLALATGGRVQRARGCLEFHGGIVRLWSKKTGFAAITFGHVILGKSQRELAICRDHEHVHVKQVERWGPFFLPAYLLASLVVFCRGGDAYRDNPFEREAHGKTKLS